MSGATPSRSLAQNVPCGPSPTATSSQISRHPGLVAQRTGTRQPAVGRDDDPGRGLDERLDDQGAELVAVASEQLGEAVGVGVVHWARRVQGRAEQGTKTAWKASMPPAATAPSVSPW